MLMTPQGVEPVIDGRRYVAFCSNDYLGLANHPEVVTAFARGAAEFGVGSGASHLITGHCGAHRALEEELAEFVGRERALLFSTGYMANLGVVSVLLKRGDMVLQDRLNHASLLDAALLSRAQGRRYHHTDVGSLERRLKARCARRTLIVTDGLFSMDGDLAPLPQLASLARNYNAWLMVDDAHALGVLGASGQGTVEHFGLEADAAPILIGTLGKAFGTFGAFVAGSRTLIEALIQGARSYIYTTALPPAVAAATRVSLTIVREEPWRRSHLQGLVARFRSGASRLGLSLPHAIGPIQPLLLGSAQAALKASLRLRKKGLFVPAIRPPTVPQGKARLRITFSTAHRNEHVDRLLDVLSDTL
jgi:8-amino-7-oxononanoate synthase